MPGRWLLLLSIPLAGCMSRSMPVPAPAAATKSAGTSGVAAAPVDPSRIEVDVRTRTVKLYPVAGGRWLVLLPGKPQQAVEGTEYRVPEGVDLDAVEFYHVVPGNPASGTVKLAQVKKK